MPRAPSADEVEAARERAARLAPLKESLAWKELRVVVAERQERHQKMLMRHLLSGKPVDQRYIDRMAGYLDGMNDLLNDPEKSDNDFVSALSRYEKAELAKNGATE